MQKGVRRKRHAFDLPCYKVFKEYLIVLGQYPKQSERSNKINVTVVVCCSLSILIPSIFQFVKSLREKDMDTMMECVPIIATISVSIIKIVNHNINRKKFENMFEHMCEQWEMSELNNEIDVLNEVTKEGSRMGTLYRISIWGVLVIFLSIPLSSPVLDFILKSNQTRTKIPLFKLNYLINTEDHFYYVYVHSAICSLAVSLVIIVMDSLYMVIFHYISGVFALCGYQIKRATEIMETDSTLKYEHKYRLLKRCLNTHYEAIKFYEYMDDSTRLSYLFQVGLNMLGITSTAVQAVMNFDRPQEAFRIAMFLFGQQFHLYTLSLPGQVLLDRSSELSDNIVKLCGTMDFFFIQVFATW
ncbi:uncharacterized protein LOC100875887 isoform X3 [Megachile rotundata]|uniref:uncharacterized protein LOC100875887 isoform X3 n=2 Tax=Megachile rotundata TaxID=143995 RepID=UPI003FD0F290